MANETLRDEFKALLREFNLSQSEAACELGVQAAQFRVSVSRGSPQLVGWGNTLRCNRGVTLDLGEGVTQGSESVTSGESVTVGGVTPGKSVTGGVTPSHNRNGVLVAQLGGMGVRIPSAELGHPEWDIMEDGFARGYRFLRGGVLEDDDVEMRRRYRTPAALRRMVEKRFGKDGEDVVFREWKKVLSRWEKDGSFPSEVK